MRLNFKYFISILNGSNRTLSCEIRSDPPLNKKPVWHRDSSSLLGEHNVVNSLCPFSPNTTCVLSNLTLIHVARGHYEGNYSLTAENDCGKASVYVTVNIMVPSNCKSDYNKPPELHTPPPLIVLAVQGESVTIKAEYKGNINDPNLLAFWCVTTLDGTHCIFPTDNDTIYNVTTVHSCPLTKPDCCYFSIAIEIKSLALDLSQANLTSAAIWLQNPKFFNPGNSIPVVNVRPTLDKWLPNPNNNVEIDEGQSTEFTCIYNASTSPNITITTWKFKEDYLQHNTSHYTMITEYGTDPANANHVLSRLILSNVTPDNAGGYSCQCVYNRDIIYTKREFYSRAKTFHLKVKPRVNQGKKKQSLLQYVITGVPFVALSIVLLMFFIWKRQKKLNRNDQNGQNYVENGQNNESDQDSDDEHAPLLNKDERCRPMEDFAAGDDVIGKSYGTINGTVQQMNIPRPKRRDSGTTKCTDQAKSEDQLIGGQECSGVLKETPSHQATNRQHGEIITEAINTPTTVNNTGTGTATIMLINQSSTPQKNDQSATTDSDAKNDTDETTGPKQTQTRPLVQAHDALPTELSIEKSEPAGSGRPEPAASSDGDVATESSYQLSNGREHSGVSKEGLTPTHQITKSLGETTDTDTTVNNAATIATTVTPIDQASTLWGNNQPATTNSDAKNDMDNAAGRRPKPSASTSGNDTTELSCTGTDKPTTELLRNFVTEIEDKWLNVGRLLLKEACTNILNSIKEKNPDDAEKCCDEMLEHWCKNCQDTCTWRTLTDKLKQIHQYAPAEKIKKDDSIKGTDKPSHKLLYKYVIKQVAPYWRELGMQLLEEESVYKLKTIEKNYPHDVEKCCSDMFEYWLETDTKANWNTLILALEHIGQNAVAAKIKMDVLKATQEEITIADLETKCPLSHALSASCDHSGGVLISEHGDLILTIPEGAIKKGDVVTFSIASFLYGPFVLPSKCQANVVSPYYWIGVSGSYKFQKPVQVEFEHYAVVTACDPSHYQLLSCEDDDESHIMRPVSYGLDFKVQDNISLCAFKTKRFCSFCLYHGCKDPMISRVAALYLKPDNYQYLTHFTVEVWFSFQLSHCLKTHKIYYEKKWMTLDASYNFDVSCDKSSTSYFTLSLNYNNDFDGWQVDHSKSRKIRTYEINFYDYYPNMTALKESEENSLFPPRFIVNVLRKPECTKDLSTAVNISLCEEGKPDKTIQFKLCVSISPSLIRKLDTDEDSWHKNDDAVDLEQLIIFIENDLPQKRLKLFASKLLCNDVIIYIRNKGEMTIESICKAAFVKEHPERSCMKISLALEQAGCDELAKAIRACFCKPK